MRRSKTTVGIWGAHYAQHSSNTFSFKYEKLKKYDMLGAQKRLSAFGARTFSTFMTTYGIKEKR
jgi:hypothetical protein